jgi:hypothetical protein
VSIDPDELAAIIERSCRGAVLAEGEAARIAAAEVRRARTVADEASAGSRFFRNVVDIHEPYLTPNVTSLLRTVELYGVDSPYANAIPEVEAPRKRIFVFEGFQQLFLYFAYLIRVLDGLQNHRANAEIVVEGERLAEPLAFSMAAFSILSNAMARQFWLPPLEDMLGPRAKSEVMYAYRAGMLFVLLHELGHIELGHLGLDGVRSERGHFDLAEPELLSEIQREELEADDFAFEALQSAYRGEIMPSLIFLFGAHAFMEVYSGHLSEKHPLAANRLWVLAQRTPLPAQDKQIVVDWIEGQIAVWRNFAGKRGDLGSGFRARIEERMPVKTAVCVVDEIKRRVAAEVGLLEAGTSDESSPG